MFRMGTASRNNISREEASKPGPGNYEVSPPKSGKSIRFGSSVRQPLNGNSTTPGPGSYQVPSRAIEGPKVKINYEVYRIPKDKLCKNLLYQIKKWQNDFSDIKKSISKLPKSFSLSARALKLNSTTFSMA